MAIQFLKEIEDSTLRFQLKEKRRYKNWLKTVAITENKKIGNIQYIFCEDNYLLNINQTYLQHDTYTDIITFDGVEGNTLHGDIFISVERVSENAGKYNVTFERELKRVMVHGLLHLCGYKDKKRADASKMRSKENDYLELADTMELNFYAFFKW